jgi:hypothetical protein
MTHCLLAQRCLDQANFVVGRTDQINSLLGHCRSNVLLGLL